jgi:hypothetical protein
MAKVDLRTDSPGLTVRLGLVGRRIPFGVSRAERKTSGLSDAAGGLPASSNDAGSLLPSDKRRYPVVVERRVLIIDGCCATRDMRSRPSPHPSRPFPRSVAVLHRWSPAVSQAACATGRALVGLDGENVLGERAARGVLNGSSTPTGPKIRSVPGFAGEPRTRRCCSSLRSIS